MSVFEQIESVRNDFLTEIETYTDNINEIDFLRNKYLGRKGLVANLFGLIVNSKKEEKPILGKKLNSLKLELSKILEDKIQNLNKDSISSYDNIDLTLPGKVPRIGSLHILEQTLLEIKNIFKSIGFSVAYGPEIDDDYHNFSALNIPEHHPARDMQDTFFIDDKIVLRTHTSNVQIHLMENEEPPIRYIVPGRVFRNEAIGYKSYCLFHQIEGIYINKNVSFSQLKGCLEFFVKQMFGSKKKNEVSSFFFSIY